MSHLVLPALETLPGWPEVVEPSLFDILLLTAIIPIGAALVMTLLGMGPTWFKRASS